MDHKVFDILSSLSFDYAILHKLSDVEDDALLAVKKERSLTEYCWTIKPSFLIFLFNHFENINSITYLDSDIFPFHNLNPIWKSLETASIILYPHNFPPKYDFLNENAGKFNAGILSLKNDNSAYNAIRWLREKSIEWCFAYNDKGRIGDQKYFLEIPELFTNVEECSNIGVHVGPWNAIGFNLAIIDNMLYVNNVPLILYHFHQFTLHKDLSYSPATTFYDISEYYIKYIYDKYQSYLLESFDIIKSYDSNYQLPNWK
jgi:hypothetical protein